MTKFKRMIAEARCRVRWAKKFIGVDMWQLDISDLGKVKARIVRDIKVIVMSLDNIAERAIGFQSVALSYFCVMAFIPLVAVSFAVTDGFGLRDKLDAIILSLDIGQDLIKSIFSASDKILESATSGLFGFISALTFIWLIIWMMMRVEKVFNNVWHVRKSSRSFFKSLGVDLVIMILSPFVVLMLYFGTIVYSHVLDLFPKWIGFSDAISSLLGWVISCGVTVMIFSAMYKFIPSARVQYRFALKSAIIAGIAFTILQYFYLETQVLVMKMNAVYGTIAAIPLFMMWLRYGWLIIIFGAQFSYSFQKVFGIESETEIEKAIMDNKDEEQE
jgi:Predicted membrane protein